MSLLSIALCFIQAFSHLPSVYNHFILAGCSSCCTFWSL